ncbi:AAA family ATPase [Clostridium sp.]|uniref:AAA family ATPase n=1 Tax=Clostridium sp. TaxID=1506 RepID=UPI003D6D5ADC
MKKNNYKKAAMEKYRILCNIIETYNKEGVKCISITSNSETEGKTIIAKNLAMSLAKHGKKVLFIDCSLPDMVKVKNINGGKTNGLIAMLQVIYNEKTEGGNSRNINDAQLINYTIDSQRENISTLSLGVNSLENYNLVFKTEYLRTIMEYLKKYYDYLIIDAPSFINLSYTQIVTAATDGCLFVLKEGSNEINEGSEIKDKIATIKCKVLGCIFNKGNDRNELFEGTNNSFSNVKYKARKVELRKSKAIV